MFMRNVGNNSELDFSCDLNGHLATNCPHAPPVMPPIPRPPQPHGVQRPPGFVQPQLPFVRRPQITAPPTRDITLTGGQQRGGRPAVQGRVFDMTQQEAHIYMDLISLWSLDFPFGPTLVTVLFFVPL